MIENMRSRDTQRRRTAGKRRAGFGAWLLAALVAAGCAGDTTPAKRPNIIFLTIDTLRADHLRLYGYERNTMPAVEEFAATAAVFDNAVVPRGSTRPSYASMLTGLYPYRHGARSNAIALHDDNVTLPELLQSAGYHTAGFVSNFVLVGEMSGLDQGFELYDDFVSEKLPNRVNYERAATRTLHAILAWLDAGPPEPFFLFTNFIDPHGPYTPPDRFRRIFQSKEARPLRAEQIPAYQHVTETHDFYDYVDRYDAEARYADEALGILIEELKAKDLWDNALVVFTADHGESMGEHKLYFTHHLHLWEETTRVPLAIRVPGPSFRPGRMRDVCSPMDLTPTVLAHLGIPVPEGLDGRSLLPSMAGQSTDDRAVLVEFPHTASPGAPDAFAARTTSHKLIRLMDPETGTLARQAVYEISKDPLEQRPIPFDEGATLHRGLAAQLEDMIAKVTSYELPFVPREYEMPDSARESFVAGRESATEKVPLTEEQIEKLRSLGYVR